MYPQADPSNISHLLLAFTLSSLPIPTLNLIYSTRLTRALSTSRIFLQPDIGSPPPHDVWSHQADGGLQP